ncbi:14-3-3-like protein GF14 iota [Bienertia sinuspersici]
MTCMEFEVATSSASLSTKPKFAALKAYELSDGQVQFRKVSVPPHRYTPLKNSWLDIYNRVYEQMKIDVRMNRKARKVEQKTRPDTLDVSNHQKCADFVHAFMLGFDIIDAIALLRNIIGARRAYWRITSSIEQKEESKGNDNNVKLIKSYRKKVEDELSKICQDILTIIDSHLVPHSGSDEAIAFYYKM